MKWVRCPQCRTVNDIDRYAMCDGCNRELGGVAPLEDPSSTRTTRDGERDSRSGSRILWVIAVLSLVGTFALPPGVTILTALVSLVLFATLFMKLGLRSVWASRVGTFAKVLGSLLAVAAALGGAALLVFIACAVNLKNANF